MNLDDLTLGNIKELQILLGQSEEPKIDNGMIGKYVIVRCHDAGVHAGVLESYNGRECVLKKSRRLWYWKPADKQSFLSGVASAGLDNASKIGAEINRLHLTENCEIIECSDKAEKTIKEIPAYEQ